MISINTASRKQLHPAVSRNRIESKQTEAPITRLSFDICQLTGWTNACRITTRWTCSPEPRLPVFLSWDKNVDFVIIARSLVVAVLQVQCQRSNKRRVRKRIFKFRNLAATDIRWALPKLLQNLLPWLTFCSQTQRLGSAVLTCILTRLLCTRAAWLHAIRLPRLLRIYPIFDFDRATEFNETCPTSCPYHSRRRT